MVYCWVDHIIHPHFETIAADRLLLSMPSTMLWPPVAITGSKTGDETRKLGFNGLTMLNHCQTIFIYFFWLLEWTTWDSFRKPTNRPEPEFWNHEELNRQGTGWKPNRQEPKRNQSATESENRFPRSYVPWCLRFPSRLIPFWKKRQSDFNPKRPVLELNAANLGLNYVEPLKAPLGAKPAFMNCFAYSKDGWAMLNG